MDDPRAEPAEPAEEQEHQVVDWIPLYDKIIVQRLPEKVQIGRMAVPEKARQAQNVGVVVRVGSGRWIDGVLYPLTVQEGNVVLFSHFAGAAIEGQKDLLVMREDEILAWKEQPPE
jgi:co-chaperonin GroES (HSP10)